MQSGGSGNFPAASLASLSGSTITVNTTGGTCGQAGATCFTVKAAGNFNVIDTVSIGATTVVSSSTAATRGLVMLGPDPTTAFPANVTCGTGAGQSPCSTVYSSANDPNSSCTIEENGPVMAVVKCLGTHKDASGNPYMQFTSRTYFYAGKNYVKTTVVLRNANYVDSIDHVGNTFNTAFKGFQSYELRIAPNVSGTLNYTIAADSTACNGGVCSGTLNGTSDTAYIYQAKPADVMHQMQQQTDCGLSCVNDFTTDLGYVAKKNTTTLATSTDGLKAPAAFYADIADSSGVGIMFGVYHGAPYWPKSLEFRSGGTAVGIGIWPSENSQPSYMPWPEWNITDVFMEFHAANPSSVSSDFLKLQHFLVGRADRSYYNSTNVFLFPMPASTDEQSFYKSMVTNASCSAGAVSGGLCANTNPLAGSDTNFYDLGTQNTALYGLQAYRYINWANSGPSNQEEFREDNLFKFLRRGQTGRLLDSMHWYRLEAEKSWAHSDGTASSSDSTINGFLWSSLPSRLDGYGRPLVVGSNNCSYLGIGPGASCPIIQNSTQQFQDWMDALHFHWEGILNYYFMFGDETYWDAVISQKSWYTTANSWQNGSKLGGQDGIGITRGIGVEMRTAAKFGEALASKGDPDAATVLAQGVTNYTKYVKPDPCMNNFPAGCTMPPVRIPSGTILQPGVSRVRGMLLGTIMTGSGICSDSDPNQYRVVAGYMDDIALKGILELRRVAGPGWPEYTNALDLAYGVSQHNLLEMFSDDGGAYFANGGGSRVGDNRYNGMRYAIAPDLSLQCPAGTTLNGRTTSFDGGKTFVDILTMPENNTYIQTVSLAWYVQQLVNGALTPSQLRQFNIQMAWPWYEGGHSLAPTMGGGEIGAVIKQQYEPSNILLQDVAFSVSDLGSGNYRLSWTAPVGLYGRANQMESTHYCSLVRSVAVRHDRADIWLEPGNLFHMVRCKCGDRPGLWHGTTDLRHIHVYCRIGRAKFQRQSLSAATKQRTSDAPVGDRVSDAHDGRRKPNIHRASTRCQQSGCFQLPRHGALFEF